MSDASWTNLANPSSWSYRDIIGQPLDALPRRVTRTVSASANVNGLDDLILVSGNSTLTLETAVGCDGRRHTFFKADSSATTMTIACSGSETLDGSATLSTAVQYAGFDVFSDGTNWHAQRVGVDLLSFQQAGTGALVRTALAKMREWISLKDFAVGDGSTNDTTAINNWLTAIAGKVGYIPEGTYMTDGGHSTPSNTTLEFAGKSAVLKLRSGVSANTRMFVNSDTTSGNTRICMKNGTLDGNRAANSGTAGLDAFVGQKVTLSEFSSMRVTGFTHHCFDFSVGNSDNSWIDNDLEDYGTTSIGFGIVVLSDCHRNRMIGNRVNSSLTNVGLAIDDQSGGTGGTPCTNNVIMGNTVIGTDIGIMVVGSHRNTVQGNTVKSPTNFGILVTPSTDAPNNAIGNTVVGNTVDIDNGVNAFGILVAGTGHRVYGNSTNRGQVGIYIQDEAGASLQTTDIVVSGNYCVSPSLYGIQVAGGANIAVTDNDIVSSADRGITVTPVSVQATPRGIFIARNKTRSCQQEGIVVESNAASAVQEVVVTENLNVDGGLAASATYASILIAQATNTLIRISVFDNRSVATTATVWGRNVQITGSVTEYDVVRNLYWGYTPTGADPNTAVALTIASEATDTTCFPLFVTAATGDLEPKTNAGLSFNSSTGALTVSTIAATNVSSASVSTDAVYAVTLVSTAAMSTNTLRAITNVSSATVSTATVYATDVIGATRVSTATVSSAAVYSGTLAATTNVSSVTLSTATVYATDVIGSTRVSTASVSSASVYAPTQVSTASLIAGTVRAATNASSATVSTASLYAPTQVSTASVLTGTLAATTNVSSATVSTATVYATDVIGATRVSTVTVSSASVYAATAVSTVALSANTAAIGTNASSATVSTGNIYSGGNLSSVSVSTGAVYATSVSTTGDATFGGRIISASTGPYSFGGTTSARVQFRFLGTFVGDGTGTAFGIRYSGTVVNGVATSIHGASFAPTLSTFTSGTHSLAAGVVCGTPTLAIHASSTITEGATLYVQDAPTGASANYSLYVDNGLPRIDSTTASGAGLGTITNTPNAGGGDPAIYLLLNVNNTSFAFPGWAL